MSIRSDIAEYIRSGETDSQGLGLEIEHFIVNDEGVQIGFDEISGLIRTIGDILNAKIIYMDGHLFLAREAITWRQRGTFPWSRRV